jgi:hypothetical protein
MKSFSAIAACALLIASAAQAQRPKSESKTVPPNLRPPAGMCRIWLDGVPASRQPAPTDCASALRNRPARGQVLFGDDYPHGDTADRTGDLPLKGLAPLPKSMEPRPADSAHTDRKTEDAGRKKPDARKPVNHKPDSTAVNVPGRLDFLR